MGTRVVFPADMIEFGGLKVAMQNSLSDAIDTVATRKKLYAGTFWTPAVRTANGASDITGFAGTQFLLVQYNITAVTITSGALNLAIQKFLPDGTSLQNICNHAITTTGHHLVQVNGLPNLSTTTITAFNQWGPVADTIYHGPWGDKIRFQIQGTGTFSINFSAYFWAFG